MLNQRYRVFLLLLISVLFSFQKRTAVGKDKSPLASTYQFGVLDKWMSMQIRLMSHTPAVFNGPFVRIYAYTGLAAYESILPGIPTKSAFWFTREKLNQAPLLPKQADNKKYHWPSSLNAAMAFMNRSLFTAAGAENKMAIDSLENALRTGFSKEADAATIERSAQFGLEVAKKIFAWAEADGYHQAGNAFAPPTGPGKWKPTPPNYARPIAPHWGSLRTMVTASTENAEVPAPIPYSEDSSSAFYREVKEVYDISQHMTPVQKQVALFWKEINPGFTAPGHWLSILRQVLQKEKAPLDKAAFAYALSGMAMNDAWISSWKTRYQYNVLRPVTYIREVMNHPDWLSFVPTPPHPEYTSGFAAMAGAVCGSLSAIFDDNYPLTDYSYADAGMGTRTYYSFTAMAKEAGDSKIFGGIHFRFSVVAGLRQGHVVAGNIARLLVQKDLKTAVP